MNIESLTTALRDVLSARTLFEDDAGRVLVGDGAIELYPCLEAACTRYERRRLEEEDLGALVGELLAPTPLLELEWLGAMSSSWAKLETLALSDTLEVLLWHGEEDLLAIAAFSPRAFASGARVVLETLVRDNGRGLGVEGIFGSLPSETTNHRPDLIDRATLARAFATWMDEAVAEDRAWWPDVIEGAAGPDDLERYLDESYRERPPRKPRTRPTPTPAPTPSEPPGVLEQRIRERFDEICRTRMPGDLRAWKALPRLDRLVYAIVVFDTQMQRNGPLLWLENGYAATHTKPVLAALRELGCASDAIELVTALADEVEVSARLAREAARLDDAGADGEAIDALYAPLDARLATIAAAWNTLRQAVRDALHAVAAAELPPLFDAETVAWLDDLIGPHGNARQRAVLAWLHHSEAAELDNARYRALTGVDARVARRELGELLALGALERDDRGRWTSYWLAPEVAAHD